MQQEVELHCITLHNIKIQGEMMTSSSLVETHNFTYRQFLRGPSVTKCHRESDKGSEEFPNSLVGD